jgi:predicted ATPase
MRSNDLYVLTGAPGSGKTAILDRLIGEIRCVGEPAREILAEQRSTGGAGTHDRDPSLFVDLLLRRSIEKHEGPNVRRAPRSSTAASRTASPTRP